MKRSAVKEAVAPTEENALPGIDSASPAARTRESHEHTSPCLSLPSPERDKLATTIDCFALSKNNRGTDQNPGILGHDIQAETVITIITVNGTFSDILRIRC